MISKFFINRPAFSAVISIIIVIAGFLRMFALPIEQYPKVTPTQVIVSGSYPGATAQTVSTSVVSVLENSINGVEDMIYIQSSSPSSGANFTINVFFSNEANPDMAVVNVNNRVQSVLSQLPSEVQRLGITAQKGSTAVVGLYHIYSNNPNHDKIYIENYALLNVVDELKRISGINVELWSLQTYAMRIWLDPNKLLTYNLTPLEVISKIEEQNSQFAPGKFGAEPIAQSEFTYNITTKGLFTSKEEFENILIRSNPDGSSLRLKDLARIELGAQDYLQSNFYNDIPSVPIRVTLQPGANMLEVSNAVNEQMERLSQKFPEGMQYSNPFRPTEFITASMEEVVKTFFEAIILVVLVIYLFFAESKSYNYPSYCDSCIYNRNICRTLCFWIFYQSSYPLWADFGNWNCC